MYCNKRDCYKDVYLDEKNYMNLCKDHFDEFESKKVKPDSKLYELNEKRIKELAAKKAADLF